MLIDSTALDLRWAGERIFLSPTTALPLSPFLARSFKLSAPWLIIFISVWFTESLFMNKLTHLLKIPPILCYNYICINKSPLNWTEREREWWHKLWVLKLHNERILEKSEHATSFTCTNKIYTFNFTVNISGTFRPFYFFAQILLHWASMQQNLRQINGLFWRWWENQKYYNFNIPASQKRGHALSTVGRSFLLPVFYSQLDLHTSPPGHVLNKQTHTNQLLHTFTHPSLDRSIHS